MMTSTKHLVCWKNIESMFAIMQNSFLSNYGTRRDAADTSQACRVIRLQGILMLLKYVTRGFVQ